MAIDTEGLSGTVTLYNKTWEELSATPTLDGGIYSLKEWMPIIIDIILLICLIYLLYAVIKAFDDKREHINE